MQRTMFKKILCLIAILKLSEARYGFVPLYGQDSAVIVDANKFLTPTKNPAIIFPHKIRIPSPFPFWRNFPSYHIIPPPCAPLNAYDKKLNTKNAAISTIKSNTVTSTTNKPRTPIKSIAISTYRPLVGDNELPIEFVNIAQSKLGLNKIDEIPSLSEMGQLLGTNNNEETLDYIKKLASNEQGIGLLKAYIESTDYTDNADSLNNKTQDIQEDKKSDIKDTVEISEKGVVVTPTEDLKNFENRDEVSQSKIQGENENIQHHHLTENNERVYNNEDSENINITETTAETSITKDLEVKVKHLSTPNLVRESIPFNFPVPIRIKTATVPSPNDTIAHNTPKMHLNTPKMLLPHVQQLSRVSKIPSTQIEDFLASRPKLLELVTKIRRFPITYDRNSPIEGQIMAAVQKTFERDDDLKKFLTSAATLN